MRLVWKGIIPPKEWHHSPKLKNVNGWTVAIMLTKKNMKVPKEWII